MAGGIKEVGEEGSALVGDLSKGNRGEVAIKDSLDGVVKDGENMGVLEEEGGRLVLSEDW